jgi:lipopolysaccharide transport system ATP-binding protein
MRAGRGLSRQERFWGLRDLTFTIARGCMFGIVGRNGAGKSTLLRLLGGLLRPDEGRVEVNGRVSGLLELGAGFHPDLTGRENIEIAGVVGGLTRREVAARFDEIVEFAELRSVIGSPLRTYSSGMHMRLAFSVAVHVDPQILLVDEVLAVGDLPFQRKCIARIRRFKKQGCSVIVVSHDLSMIRELCDDALWLEQGRMKRVGTAEEVVRAYSEDALQETLRRTRAEWEAEANTSGTKRVGSREVEISTIDVISPDYEAREDLVCGEPLQLEISYFAPEPVRDPVFFVCIIEEEGRVHFKAATDSAYTNVPVVEGHGKLSLKVKNLQLEPGEYYVDVAVYEKDWRYAYDYHSRVYCMRVRRGPASHSDSRGGARAEWAVA